MPAAGIGVDNIALPRIEKLMPSKQAHVSSRKEV
jgi:phosphopantetheinyl transferase (holo-ACP synthase)